MRVAALLVVCMACGSDDGTSTGAPAEDVDLVGLIANPGPYGAGYATSTMSYEDPTGDGARQMHLAWWYPTDQPSVDAELQYRSLLMSADAVADAPLRAGTYPVAVFSHGHQAFAEASGRLMAHLASHGWLVVAPDHTDNTLFDGDDRATEIYVQRPLDIFAVLDHVESGADPDFGGAADMNAVVVLGHSFGGYSLFALAGAQYDLDTLLPACADGTGPSSFCSTITESLADRLAQGFTDPRVDAWVPMAPGDFNLFGSAGMSGLSAPVLLMSGDLDPRATDNPASYWAAMDRGDHRHLVVTGGGHQTFTDYSEVLESFEGLIGADDGWRIVNAYLLAFARRHALDDATMQPVLDGTLEISDQAVLEQ